jgi:AcrR family transcriptional regulator
MATASSQPSRVARRRAAVRDEALDHAVDVMTEEGVGALTVSEVARRMGIRGPSLYKYFPSRFALYDALFARGLAAQAEVLRDAVAASDPGIDRIRAGGTALVRWAVENPALAQLLYWRPVPGFAPSPESYQPAQEFVAEVATVVRTAAELGQIHPDAAGDEGQRLLSVLVGGALSAQAANEPDATFADGRYVRLLPRLLELFTAAYPPEEAGS